VVHPEFKTDQRKRLTALGVTAEQIAELARILPSIAAYGTRPVKLGDVRKRLSAIAESARLLARELNRLSRGGNDPALNVTSYLLWDAHGVRLRRDRDAVPLDKPPRNPPPDKLATEITRLSEVANSALKQIAGRQARHCPANPQAISFINYALLEGWCKTHNAHLSGNDLRASNCPPLPEYPFAPGERGHRAKFRKVVEICYQASGHPNPDPERAVKAHGKLERKQFASLFEWTEISPTHGIGKRKDSRSKK
jgi:hypothetical protein